MNKPPPHRLDSLFKAKLRSISMRQFELCQKDLTDVPQPWRWPDPKTGREWTLMGRKGELLWHASEAHFVKNHSVALHSVQQAIKHKEEWHESLPGTPDILLFWLGTMRYGVAHGRTQDLISRALSGRAPGNGIPGDGGFLDQTITLVEQEVDGATSPSRRRVIHDTTAGKWLNGCILRSIQPGAADWRTVGQTTMPIMWPIETVERVFRLAHETNVRSKSLLMSEKDGDALVEQIRRFEPSPSLMALFIKDACNDLPGKLPAGIMRAIEHYHSRGMEVEASFIDKLAEHIGPETKARFPSLSSTVERHLMAATTPTSTPTRPSSRL